jgi:hypothetical protein
MTSRSIRSNSDIPKSQQADGVCPSTPTPPSPRKKTYQISPNRSPNKASKHHKSQQAYNTPTTTSKTYQINPDPSPNKASSKHNKELKVLTNLVQGLALKLKKSDRKVQQVLEEADKLHEVTLRLESTNKSIADAAAKNQTLSRRVKNLQSTIDMEGGLASNLESAEDTTTSRAVAVDDISKRLKREEEFRQLEIQCTYAAFKEKEKEGVLAESKAETEELRCQLAALTSLLQHQNSGSSSVHESPRPSLLSSPAKSMKRLSGLLKSPKKAPKCTPLL